MNAFWVALGTVSGLLGLIVLVVGGISLAVSWAVVKLAERRMRDGGGR